MWGESLDVKSLLSVLGIAISCSGSCRIVPDWLLKCRFFSEGPFRLVQIDCSKSLCCDWWKVLLFREEVVCTVEEHLCWDILWLRHGGMGGIVVKRSYTRSGASLSFGIMNSHLHQSHEALDLSTWQRCWERCLTTTSMRTDVMIGWLKVQVIYGNSMGTIGNVFVLYFVHQM